MITKKDLVVVALATFCLTATLFMIIPTRSAYDPWADLKEDGKVDILDAILLANAYGTSGDPTKNVNVTNPRARKIEQDLNISITNSTGIISTDAFETEGYSRMFVAMATVGMSHYRNLPVDIRLIRVNWEWGTSNGANMMTYSYPDQNRQLDINWGGEVGLNIPVASWNGTSNFEVETNRFSLTFSVTTGPLENGWILIRTWIYLRNE